MPQRPKQHVVRDQAATAVANVVADAGFAAETVVQDYGEDLLVQTSHAGKMDASRLWIQVKGTARLDRYRRADGFSYSASAEQVVRWARSADPVIVVLWDVETNKGWYAWPLWQASHLNPGDSGAKSTTLHFAADDEFTPAGIELIAWEARARHFRSLILDAEDDAAAAEEEGGDPSLANQRHTVITLDFMLALELIERVDPGPPERFAVPEHARDAWLEELSRTVDDDGSVGEVELAAATAATVLRYAARACPGLGFQRLVLTTLMNGLYKAMSIGEMRDRLST